MRVHLFLAAVVCVTCAASVAMWASDESEPVVASSGEASEPTVSPGMGSEPEGGLVPGMEREEAHDPDEGQDWPPPEAVLSKEALKDFADFTGKYHERFLCGAIVRCQVKKLTFSTASLEVLQECDVLRLAKHERVALTNSLPPAVTRDRIDELKPGVRCYAVVHRVAWRMHLVAIEPLR